ncbi:hypothetical protein HYT58_00540, partial [Candidatus Woesearchaeota archaeon]|nr:hypothetical protein [Candidatus Woesearchaeota archaeon]
MKERLLLVVFITVIVISLYLGVFYTLTLSTTKISGHAVSTTQDEKLFKFQTNSDVLELREALGSVYPALTSKELPELLKSGKSTSNKGSTDYNQYLRFEDSNSLQKVMVNFTKDGSGVTDYLQIKSGSNISDAILEYELEFEEGFQSDIKSARLEDIEDEELNILGRVFSVTSTSIDTSAKKVQLTLLSAPLVQILAEQETKKFTLDGKDYVVEAYVISDSEVNPEVRLKIGDETTDALEEGETYTLKDGTKLGIDDIIQSENSQDQVKIFLAAEKLYFEDTYNDEAFSQGIKVNDGTLSNAYIKIKATSTDSEFTLSSLKYRVTSADDIYLPKSELLSEEIKKESFLTGAWDIKYNGLSDVSTTEVKIEASGDTQLKLHFTNKKDKVYIFPFVNREGSGIFRLGDSTRSLFFIEGSNRTDFNINQQDYFILSNRNDRTGETHVLRYNSIDTSSKT